MAEHTYWGFSIHDGYHQDLGVAVGDEITWHAISGHTVTIILPSFLGAPSIVQLDGTTPSVTRRVTAPTTRPDDPDGGYHYTIHIDPGGYLAKGPNGPRPRILVGPGGTGGGFMRGPGRKSREDIKWPDIWREDQQPITWPLFPSHAAFHFIFPAALGGGYEEVNDPSQPVTRTLDLAGAEPPAEGIEYTVVAEPGHVLVKGDGPTGRPRILVGPGGTGGSREPGPGGEAGEEVEPGSVGEVDTATWVLANAEGGELTGSPGQKVEWLPADGYTLEFSFPPGLFGVGSAQLPPKAEPLVKQLLGNAKSGEYDVVAQPGNHVVQGPGGGRPRIIISVTNNPPPSRRGGSGGPKSTRAKPGGARGRG